MSLIDDINNKIDSLQNEEYSIIETKEMNAFDDLNDSLSAIVTSATVLYINIKNIPFFTKNDGKRAASKIYKMYQEVLRLFANDTNGVFACYTNSSFLVFYPSSIKDVDIHITNAFKLSYIIGKILPQKHPQFSSVNITIGVDHGRILGTKCDHGRLWFGACIDKAAAISDACTKPSYLGISRLIYSEIGEDLRTITHHVLGFSKKEMAWQKGSYQFENESKHYYSTRHNLEI
ncbi:MAG: hypothetical protein KBT57_00525 [bacterium]|nr:hypothetical protein [Candidatus Limimorpha equi]